MDAKEGKEGNALHIKDWPIDERPREMLSQFSGFLGLLSATHEDLLEITHNARIHAEEQ
jgi:hypothetical protein